MAKETDRKLNGMAISSMIFAFIFPLLGLILGVSALKQIKNSGDRGEALAISGIIVSSVLMVIISIPIIYNSYRESSLQEQRLQESEQNIQDFNKDVDNLNLESVESEFN